MNNYIITSGDFTKQGNFTGYTSKGIRIHFHARQMASLKFSKENPPVYPFYCIAEVKTYNARKDEQGNAIPFEDGKTEMSRLTATSAFLQKDNLINAHVEESLLDREIAHEINKISAEKGFTSTDVATLSHASI
jgi:hypothetical protein